MPVVVATVLLLLGLVNIVQRATQDDVEDGVLWVQRSTGVVAAEVDARSPAGRAGVRPGDVLLAIDGQSIEARDDVHALQQSAQRGARHVYTLLALGDRRVAQVTLQPIPRGVGGLYYVLAAVGIFSLLVGATVRTRRPTDQATLHFFWLSVAFYGVFTFSFSGRLDRVDWVFYWADQIATLLLPPLFVHFALVFPERPRLPALAALADRRWAWLYALPALLGLLRAGALLRASVDPAGLIGTIAVLDRLEPLYIGALSARRPGDLRRRAGQRALDHGAAPAALDRLGHGASAPARSCSPTPCRSPSARRRRWRWSSRRSRSASCRWPSPRPSSATG